jgi:Lon protease-like protein
MINLHIFEARYKEMINLCLETHQPFGVVLIAEGREAYGPATPHMVGCTAHITQVHRLNQGRMEIRALGRDRFEIRSLRQDLPYLVGDVNLRPLVEDNPAYLMASARRLQPWVRRYLKLLARIENTQLSDYQLPNDPVHFAYLAAKILQYVPMIQKQGLLTSNQPRVLLAQVQRLYEVEVALLEMMINRAENHDDVDMDPASFSLN